ncbi:unnamed protein product, partial [marine sediment metagenome]
MAQKTIVTLADLKPDPKNARRHNQRNVGVIVDALHEVGAARSIVVDEDGRVLAGNATIEAAAEAGIEKVLVVDTDGETLVAVRRSGLTEEQKVRLALLDNRSAELADWSPEALALLLNEDEDVLDGLFYDNEIEELLGDLLQEEPPEDPGAQLDKADELQEKWQVSTGQIWQCGEHFIICGDCRETETWERLLAAAGVDKVNGVFTSPPYAEQRKEQYGGVPV